MTLRRLLRRAAHPLVGGLLLAACGGASAAPVGVAGMPDLREYVEADEPPMDLPADVLELKPPEREADRLLARTRRTQNLCTAMGQLQLLEEPSPHDIDDLLGYASQYLGTLQAIDPTGKVHDPDDEGEEIEVPDEIMDNLATQEQAWFAYIVRLTYIKMLQTETQLSDAELNERLQHAFVQLYHSEFTAADHELVAALPHYC